MARSGGVVRSAGGGGGAGGGCSPERVANGGGSNAPGGSFYGREAFEPGRIVLQIAAIHVFFYATFAGLLFVLNHVLGVTGSGGGRGTLIIDQMLAYRALSLRTGAGLAAALALVVSAVGCGSLAFVAVVGRARRALDFAATMMAVHALCCSLYGGVPRTATWWALNLGCTAAMTVVCETAARRVELREIAVPTRDIEDPADEDVVRPA